MQSKTRHLAGQFVLKQRDSYSLELKFTHLPAERRRDSYRLDLFLFFPASFGINSETYPHDRLYRDLKLYIRLSAPTFSAAELLANDPSSPLWRIEQAVHSAPIKPRPALGAQIMYELRLLACIYKSLLRSTFHRLSANRTEAAAPIQQLADILQRLHGLSLRLPEDAGLRFRFRLMDEHISLLFEHYLARWLQSITASPDLLALISEQIGRESQYRSNAGYGSVLTAESAPQERERYLYREKMLKRYASEVLFFNIRQLGGAMRAEHLLYALAAGIAMSFATAIAFFGQTLFGNLTLALFVLLVASYILKDRLKDIFRHRFRRFIGAYFYDRRRKLYEQRHRRTLALVRERSFFTARRRLDPTLLQLRAQGDFERLMQSVAGEAILVYNRRVDIHGAALHASHIGARGLADVSIISLRHVLRFISTLKIAAPIAVGGRLKFQQAHRAYHLNLIVRLSQAAGVELRRFRLIVDGKGIRRIEMVDGAP